MNTNLLNKTLSLARSTHLTVVDICRAAEVTPRWYYMFLSSQISDPGVRRVQRLHDYLVSVDGGVDADIAADESTLLPQKAVRDVG